MRSAIRRANLICPHTVTALIECLSWGIGDLRIADFQHLRSGRVRHSNCDSEYRSGRSTTDEHKHFAGRGPDSVLSSNSESIEQSGMTFVAKENSALASLYGRIDIDSSPAVRDRLITVLQSPLPRTVSIDLSAVTHIDSSGVATLIEALKIARHCKTELRLQGLNDRLHRLFEATGILSLFNEGIEK
jgi:anti-sigma B factor antagonist